MKSFEAVNPYVLSLSDYPFVVVVFTMGKFGVRRYNKAVRELRRFTSSGKNGGGFIAYNEDGGVVLMSTNTYNSLVLSTDFTQHSTS